MYSSHFGLAAFSGAIGESGQTVVQHTPVRMTPSGPVCENGRPFVTDPCTGQAVCMCQVGSEGLPYPASLGSPEGLRSLRHSPGSTEPSAFRSPLTCATGLRPDRESWKAMTPSLAHHYDHSLALHPYSTFYAGLDLNSAARRKAATRETTSPLKAWLSEHRKNPYPTKAEKIMLAIITKMTMTQVSTWFANARRRLKKENKMCWDVNERDEDDKDDDLSEKESNDDKSEGHPVAPSVKSEDEDSEVQLSDISDIEDNVQSAASRLQPDPRVLHSTPRHENTLPTDYSIPHHPVLRTNQSANICVQNRTASAPKPKIWSISHILEPKDESSTSDSNDTSAVTSSPVIVTSSPVIVTSSRLNHELSSHVTIDHSVHPSVYPASLESPRYRVCEGSQEKTPSPRKTSPGGHPRPPLDTPPDTPPFDNQQQSSTYFKEEKTYEYEALNLKTDRSEESPRT